MLWGQYAAYHKQTGMLLFRDINYMMLGMDPELICSMMGNFLMISHRVITNYFEETRPSWDKMQ